MWKVRKPTQAEIARFVRCCESNWNVIPSSPLEVCNEMLDLEHCLHELSHALTLGLELTGDIQVVVGSTLKSQPYVLRIINEAMAFAIEFHAFRELGFLLSPWQGGVGVHEENLIDGAEMQGVLRETYEHFRDQYDTRELGSCVAHLVTTVVDDGEVSSQFWDESGVVW